MPAQSHISFGRTENKAFLASRFVLCFLTRFLEADKI